ncbi:MAG: tetratricopeptide repeat protein, partial [Pyrinomonadaceae bacterium]
LYAAGRLLRHNLAPEEVRELAEASKKGVEPALDTPVVTNALMADELRDARARAINLGATPDIPEVPRHVLSNIMRGRIEETLGWNLFNQNRVPEAVIALRRAVSVLPENSLYWRGALWRLGAALHANDQPAEALAAYLKSYNLREPNPARLAVVEALYREVNGSLEGFEQKLGAVASSAVTAGPRGPSDTSSARPTRSPTRAARRPAAQIIPPSLGTPLGVPAATNAAATATDAPRSATIATPAPELRPAQTDGESALRAATDTPAESRPNAEKEGTNAAAPARPLEGRAAQSPTPEPSPSPAVNEPSPEPSVTATPEPNPTPPAAPARDDSSSSPTRTSEGPAAAAAARPTPEISDAEVQPRPVEVAATKSDMPAPPTLPALPRKSPEPTDDTPPPEEIAATAPAAASAPTRRRRRATPEPRNDCPLALDAESVSLDNNGGAALVSATFAAGAAGGEVTATTSDWSHIVIFREPATDAAAGLFKFTITSISNTTGTFSVVFKVPCGKKELAVTVK